MIWSLVWLRKMRSSSNLCLVWGYWTLDWVFPACGSISRPLLGCLWMEESDSFLGRIRINGGRESERNYFTFLSWNSKQRLPSFTFVRCATRCMPPLFWWKLQLPLAPLSILFTHCWVDRRLAADRRRRSCDQKLFSSILAKSVFCSWL